MLTRKLLSIAILCVIPSVILIACRKNDTSPAPTPPPDTGTVAMTPYELLPPRFFPQAFIPDDNKLYKERIELGRMLYYDPILSNDGRACASCHMQEKGFTVPGTYMNMPVLPHVNLAWYTNYMWDGSKKGTVEDLMLFEVKDFFGTNLEKMNASEKYRELFKKYYGTDNITYKELSYALAQFIRTLVSRDTRFEQYMLGKVSLTKDEFEGYLIFSTERGDCFHCHTLPIMTDNLLHNTGIDSVYTNEADRGHYNVTGNPADMGKFRTPNLRNVALRDRFMHDGRFSTLEEVVAFYNSGVRRVETLDPIMTKPGKEHGLMLSDGEQKQLIAFLKTFTDSTFITNPDLSRPE